MGKVARRARFTSVRRRRVTGDQDGRGAQHEAAQNSPSVSGSLSRQVGDGVQTNLVGAARDSNRALIWCLLQRRAVLQCRIVGAGSHGLVSLCDSMTRLTEPSRLSVSGRPGRVSGTDAKG